DPHRHGQDRPRRAPPPAAVHGPGPARHPRCDRGPLPARVRLRRPRPRRPRRDRLRGRPRARLEPHRRRRGRLRHRAGAPRTRPHPPLHAGPGHGRTRPRPRPRARERARRVRRAARREGHRPHLGRRVPHRTGGAAAARVQDRLAHGHRRQQARHDGDPGDQDRRPPCRAAHPRPGDAAVRRRRTVLRSATRRDVRRRARHAARGRPRRGPSGRARQGRAAAASLTRIRRRPFDAGETTMTHRTDAAVDGPGYGTLSIASILAETARRSPDRPALYFMGRSITYGALWEQTRAYAGALAARGIGPGSRVAMIVPNVPDFPRVYYAALALGAVVVPVHLLFRADEIEFVLRDAEADVVVAAAPMLAEAAPAAARA